MLNTKRIEFRRDNGRRPMTISIVNGTFILMFQAITVKAQLRISGDLDAAGRVV
jgi:hypothetical protein